MRLFKIFLTWFYFLFATVTARGADFIPRTDKMVLGTPSSAANKVIEFNMGSGNPKPQIRANKTTGSLEFTNDGTYFSQIGKGSGGKNLLTNGDFESGLTSWTCFKSAAASRPADGMTFGTGQTITLTTTATALAGTTSGVLTKPASNVQGEGCYTDFVLETEDLTTVQKIVGSYKITSGTFVAGSNGSSPTDSDVIFYLYDRDANKIIEPSSIKLFSNVQDEYDSTFQTGPTNKNLRLIAYFATTSTQAFTLSLDSLKISKSVYVYGTPQAYLGALTTTGSWTTNTTYSGQYWRDGDFLFADIKIATSGAPTATTLTLNLPPGYTIDASKIPSADATTRLGGGGIYDAGSDVYESFAYYASSTTVGIRTGLASGTYPSSYTAVSSTVPMAFGAGDSVNIKYKVPILGFSSSVQMSDSADTRVVAAKISRSAASSYAPNNSNVKINFDVAIADTHNGFDSVNNRYNIPVSGWYEISFSVGTNTTNVLNNWYFLTIKKNGTSIQEGGSFYPAASTQLRLTTSTKTYCNAGDYIEGFLFGQGNNSVSTLSGVNSEGATNLSIARLSGPSAIAATVSIEERWTGSTTAISAGATTTLVFPTKSKSTHGAFDPATGIFKAPSTGWYSVKAHVGGTWGAAANNFIALHLYKNSSQYSYMGRIYTSNASSTTGVGGADDVYLLSGETVEVRFANSLSQTFTADGSNVISWVSITRTGN